VVVEHPLLARALAADRVAHAYAFIGPEGSGRRAAAVTFARALLGTDAPTHPDLHVIEPTPPEQNPRGPRAIRIADIRALEHAASLRPVRGRWKVFIVEDADRMTGEAPQAFLKTLEEPPAGTVIILILTRARAVPATVLSRCQIVRFQPRPGETAEAERAAIQTVLREVAEEGGEAVMRHAQAVDRDRHRAEAMLDALWLWHRDLLRAKAGVASDETAARAASAQSLEQIFAALALCRDAWRALGVNVSPRLTLEIVLSRLAPGAA
jgi:DNA polymerase-3 subunit delta'